MTDSKPEFDTNDFVALIMCFGSAGACLGIVKSPTEMWLLIPLTVLVWATLGRYLIDKWL